MIDRMSGRVSLLLVGAALVLILLLGWLVLISPERSKATKLDSQVNETNVQLQAVTSLLEGPVGRQSLAALRLTQTAVPDDTKMSQILRQLSAAAGQSGVEIDGISPQALLPLDGAQALPMTVSVKGHYFALQSFFRILRNEAKLSGTKVVATGRLYTVDNIQFSGQGPALPGATGAAGADAGGGGLVAATITITAYVFAPAPVSLTTTDSTETTSTPTATTSTPTTTTP